MSFPTAAAPRFEGSYLGDAAKLPADAAMECKICYELIEWTREMNGLGLKNDCEFDGWGTNPAQ